MSAGQRKFAGLRLTFYCYATLPTSDCCDCWKWTDTSLNVFKCGIDELQQAECSRRR